MDIEVEDIALEAQTILHGRFQIREVHYIGEQGITYIGYDIDPEKGCYHQRIYALSDCKPGSGSSIGFVQRQQLQKQI